jgi:orotidine-5'-phosphate decarboxylase
VASTGRRLYEEVMLRSQMWATPDQLMYVVGATHPDKIESIRALAPEHFFLVPGVGAQGGDLSIIMKHGMNKQCGLLINAARSIIYASSEKDFAQQAAREAAKLQQRMETHLNR